jgi:dihydrofolate synthase / folylpolyglutamate synthase
VFDAERYLLSLELFGMRFGLDRMRRLMTVLDSPQERFASVHVVGTNGKSSTARMTAAILQRHGLHTGAYLSPHLGSFAERIEIDGVAVSQARFAAAVQRAAQAAALVDRTLGEGDRVTQFEALTAAAYRELARSDVEVAVVEAGLGGRYDATSVIDSRVQVLTNVGLEHTRWLGPTERHIAEEKLAVVTPGGTLVTGPLGADSAAVAERVAAEQGARLVRAGRDFRATDEQPFTVETPGGAYPGVELRALGGFQRMNFAVAVAAAEAFMGRSLDPEAVRRAARELVLPGRLEVVAGSPLLVLDGAHNPTGARALAESVPGVVGERPVTAVISILEDKDAAGILSSLVPLCEGAVFTRSSRPGVLPPAVLESLWRQLGGSGGQIVPDSVDALATARSRAGAGGAVLVTGSIYLLAELVGRLGSLGTPQRTSQTTPRSRPRRRPQTQR